MPDEEMASAKAPMPSSELVRAVEDNVDPAVFLLSLCTRVVGEMLGLAESLCGEPRTGNTNVIHQVNSPRSPPDAGTVSY